MYEDIHTYVHYVAQCVMIKSGELAYLVLHTTVIAFC